MPGRIKEYHRSREAKKAARGIEGAVLYNFVGSETVVFEDGMAAPTPGGDAVAYWGPGTGPSSQLHWNDDGSIDVYDAAGNLMETVSRPDEDRPT